MKKNTTLYVIIIIAIALFSIILLKVLSNRPSGASGDTASSTPILYYRDDCPHCKNVEAYLLENKVEETIKIEHKEVAKNIVNNDELVSRAAKCGIDRNSIGVPLLYTGGKCYTGDQDIINYFQSRL